MHYESNDRLERITQSESCIAVKYEREMKNYKL